MNRSTPLLAAGLLLPLAACAGQEAGADFGAIKENASVTIATNELLGNLDPQSSSSIGATIVTRYAYDAPVFVDAKAQVKPGIVTEWQGSGRSYTLTVRQGVTCSDGSAMNAEVIAENINYVADPEKGSALTGLAVPSGARATADNAAGKVQVKLPEDNGFFVQNLALLPLVCSAGMKDRGSLATASSGSGPYVITKVVPDQSIEYKLRDDYTWGPPGYETTGHKGQPGTMTLKVVENESTRANLVLSGQVNIAQVGGANTSRFKGSKLYSADVNVPGSDLTFNHDGSSPASDVKVRQALVMLLDREKLAKVDSAGFGEPANGVAADPRVCPGATTDALPPYDEAAAAETLDAAGWKKDADGMRVKAGKKLTIELIYLSVPATQSQSAEYMATQWKAAGVDVKLRQMSKSAELDLLFGGGGGWDAALLDSNFGNPGVFVAFMAGPFSPDGLNYGKVNNSDYKSSMTKAQKKPGTDGCDLWNQAERALFSGGDYLPLSQASIPYWGSSVKFDIGGPINVSPVPTSIRAYS